MVLKTPQWLLRAYNKLFAHELVRFIFVGGMGFVINFIMLALLYGILGLLHPVSAAISIEVALLATFWGNNFWAFVGHHHIPVREKLIKFHATAGIGAGINYGCQIVLVDYLHAYFGLGLVVGSLAGLVWNYTMNKKIIFKVQQEPADELDGSSK